MRITNKVTNGRRVTVYGYGACGKGVASNFRAAHALVSVVEVDPVKRLQAHLDGFATPGPEAGVAGAEVIITVTGARNVIAGDLIEAIPNGAILMNAGHFPHEIDVEAIRAASESETDFADDIQEYVFADGRTVYVLANGHMVNLAGPRPMGNSIESMDLGFSLQARCLEAVANGTATAEQCVVPVPREIDEAVANAYLALNSPLI